MWATSACRIGPKTFKSMDLSYLIYYIHIITSTHLPHSKLCLEIQRVEKYCKHFIRFAWLQESQMSTNTNVTSLVLKDAQKYLLLALFLALDFSTASKKVWLKTWNEAMFLYPWCWRMHTIPEQHLFTFRGACTVLTVGPSRTGRRRTMQGWRAWINSTSVTYWKFLMAWKLVRILIWIIL